MDLPDGWECMLDEDVDRIYYINHNERTTQWIHPITGAITTAEQALKTQQTLLWRGGIKNKKVNEVEMTTKKANVDWSKNNTWTLSSWEKVEVIKKKQWKNVQQQSSSSNQMYWEKMLAPNQYHQQPDEVVNWKDIRGRVRPTAEYVEKEKQDMWNATR